MTYQVTTHIGETVTIIETGFENSWQALNWIVSLYHSVKNSPKQLANYLAQNFCIESQGFTIS